MKIQLSPPILVKAEKWLANKDQTHLGVYGDKDSPTGWFIDFTKDGKQVIDIGDWIVFDNRGNKYVAIQKVFEKNILELKNQGEER